MHAIYIDVVMDVLRPVCACLNMCLIDVAVCIFMGSNIELALRISIDYDLWRASWGLVIRLVHIRLSIFAIMVSMDIDPTGVTRISSSSQKLNKR